MAGSIKNPIDYARPSNKTRFVLILAICLPLRGLAGTTCAGDVPVGPLPGMVECRVGEIRTEGMILTWSSSEIILLTRDGSVKHIPRSLAADFRKTSDTLVPLPIHDVRSQLQREFGTEYRVESTTHYLVVLPASANSQWGSVFESLFREAWRFAAQRKLPVTKPVFPLVAVVYRDRKAFENSPEFRRFKSHESQVLGLYDVLSNRCLTFDRQATQNPAWSTVGSESTENVLRHEAFHQFAANTGLLGRFTATPSWLAEGLAMMFEDSHQGGNDLPSSATNNSLRRIAVQSLSGLPPGWLQNIVASDGWFDIQPRKAYLASWAAVSYLSDRHLSQFVGYLRCVQNRAPFQPYPSAARIRDFEASFGRNWGNLERNIVEYVTK